MMLTAVETLTVDLPSPPVPQVSMVPSEADVNIALVRSPGSRQGGDLVHGLAAELHGDKR